MLFVIFNCKEIDKCTTQSFKYSSWSNKTYLLNEDATALRISFQVNINWLQVLILPLGWVKYQIVKERKKKRKKIEKKKEEKKRREKRVDN